MTGSPGRLLAIDTATSLAVIALGGLSGELLAEDSWRAGYRHGEELLTRIDALLAASATDLTDLAGILVGTGPGAFTGLRVGLATAKGLAHGLGRPIVGVATGRALLAATERALLENGAEEPERRLALLLPAGPSDRVLVLDASARLLPGGEEVVLPPGSRLVAVDLADRAPSDALALGSLAHQGLGAALLRLGAARLASDGGDDLAGLVPEYVTLPRGVARESGAVSWSRDPR